MNEDRLFLARPNCFVSTCGLSGLCMACVPAKAAGVDPPILTGMPSAESPGFKSLSERQVKLNQARHWQKASNQRLQATRMLHLA
jgi:hypothetical protein